MRDWKWDWELSQKATEGPWIPIGKQVVIPFTRPEGPCGHVICNCLAYKNADATMQKQAETNAMFIANARVALPYWLRRVKELQEETLPYWQRLEKLKAVAEALLQCEEERRKISNSKGANLGPPKELYMQAVALAKKALGSDKQEEEDFEAEYELWLQEQEIKNKARTIAIAEAEEQTKAERERGEINNAHGVC